MCSSVYLIGFLGGREVIHGKDLKHLAEALLLGGGMGWGGVAWRGACL